MSTELHPGLYFIRNEESPAGRSLSEDRSLNPKAVICPTDAVDDPWEIELLPNGKYILKARGAPTGERDGYVFAFLREQEEAREWVITHRSNHGKQYTIQDTEGKGWTAQTDAEGLPKVAVKHLLVNPSLPPQFQRTALWTIESAEN